MAFSPSPGGFWLWELELFFPMREVGQEPLGKNNFGVMTHYLAKKKNNLSLENESKKHREKKTHEVVASGHPILSGQKLFQSIHVQRKTNGLGYVSGTFFFGGSKRTHVQCRPNMSGNIPSVI